MEGFVNELSRTLALANRFLLAELEKTDLAGLAPSHGDILAQLFEGGPVSMSDLSRRIARDPSTATALVKKLVALGLAKTAKCPTDRRSTIVELTEKGRSLQRDFDAISKRLQAMWAEGVDEADLAATHRVLEAVQGNLRGAIAEEDPHRAP